MVPLRPGSVSPPVQTVARAGGADIIRNIRRVNLPVIVGVIGGLLHVTHPGVGMVALCNSPRPRAEVLVECCPLRTDNWLVNPGVVMVSFRHSPSRGSEILVEGRAFRVDDRLLAIQFCLESCHVSNDMVVGRGRQVRQGNAFLCPTVLTVFYDQLISPDRAGLGQDALDFPCNIDMDCLGIVRPEGE